MTWRNLILIAALLPWGCDDGDSASDDRADGAAEGPDQGTGGAPDASPGDADPGEDATPPVEVTPEALAAAADITRLGGDLELVARPRYPGTPHWQAVQDRCAEVFAAAGFAVERHAYGTGTNVVGIRRGVSRADEQVVVSAHYDGLYECAGADDNASGVAAVLEAARLLGGETYARTLVVACWDEEERGLIGSRAWVERAAARGERFHASYVLETIGYRSEEPGSQLLPQGFDAVFPAANAELAAREFRGDFLAAVADDINPSAATDLKAAGEMFGLPVIVVTLAGELRASPLLADFRRSDHAPFWDHGFPGIMFTDTANFRTPYYHCERGEDDIAEVDLDFVLRAAQAVAAAAATQLELEAGEVGELPTWPPDLPPPAPDCDPVAQDCADGKKCAMVLEANTYHERCVDPPAEPAGTGEGCTRPGGVVGIDTCGTGFCAFWGLPEADPQPRVCRMYCGADEACADGETCVRLAGVGRPGVCVPSCDPLANDCDEGTACGPAANVDPSRAAFYCQFLGDVPAGQSCAAGRCAPGLICDAPAGTLELRCRAFCDEDGDCPASEHCNPVRLEKAPPGFGYCVPRVE